MTDVQTDSSASGYSLREVALALDILLRPGPRARCPARSREQEASASGDNLLPRLHRWRSGITQVASQAYACAAQETSSSPTVLSALSVSTMAPCLRSQSQLEMWRLSCGNVPFGGVMIA